jgi:hypothetical protein
LFTNKKDEINGTYRMHWEEKYTHSGNVKEIDCLEDLSVDDRITLTQVLKYGTWTGLI